MSNRRKFEFFSITIFFSRHIHERNDGNFASFRARLYDNFYGRRSKKQGRIFGEKTSQIGGKVSPKHLAFFNIIVYLTEVSNLPPSNQEIHRICMIYFTKNTFRHITKVRSRRQLPTSDKWLVASSKTALQVPS